MKKALLGLITALLCSTPALSQYVQLTGTLQGSNGVTAENYTLSFTPNQWFFVAGTSVVIGATTNCATSTDGSVVQIGNPLQVVTTSPAFTGTLPPGNYYVEYSFYTATPTETLPSPEMVVQLTSTGQITVNSPAGGIPAGAVGMRVYIGVTPGGETLQGSTVGAASFVQSIPLVTGATAPSTNNTVCKQVANDAGWPTGTGYKVGLADSAGNSIPGYPMLWQLLGPNTTVNLSNGLPYYNGVVTFPSPLLASPFNHNTQSISGSLNFSGYSILNVGAIGVGTSTPAWALDVVNGFINTNFGYLYQGTHGTIGQCLVSDGTAYRPGSCGVTPTLYYQHAQSSGTLLPQEPFINFTNGLGAADNPGSTRTDVGLTTTAVTPGSYTNTNMTVDAFGRITAATNGPAIPVQKLLIINSGICSTTNSAYASCNFGATWPGAAFADTAYVMGCTTPPPTTGVLNGVYWGNKTTTGFTVYLQNGTSAGAAITTVPEVDCWASHP